MAASVVAMDGVAGFANDVGELEWTIFHEVNLAEKSESRRKKLSRKAGILFSSSFVLFG